MIKLLLVLTSILLLLACSDNEEVYYGTDTSQPQYVSTNNDGFDGAEFIAGAVVGNMLSSNSSTNNNVSQSNQTVKRTLNSKQPVKTVQSDDKSKLKKVSLTKKKAVSTKKKQVRKKRIARASSKRSSSRRK